MNSKKVLVVFGTRLEAIQMTPLVKELELTPGLTPSYASSPGIGKCSISVGTECDAVQSGIEELLTKSGSVWQHGQSPKPVLETALHPAKSSAPSSSSCNRKYADMGVRWILHAGRAYNEV